MLPVVSMVFSRKSKINRRAGRAWPNQDPRPFTGAEKHRGVYPKGVSLVKKQKKSFRMPTAFTVLILLTIVIAIITRFIPVITPAKLSDVIMVPINCFSSAQGVSLFVLVLVLGGFLGVVMKTGALNAAITTVVKKLNSKEIYMIPILMFLISLGGTTCGMAEKTIAF